MGGRMGSDEGVETCVSVGLRLFQGVEPNIALGNTHDIIDNHTRPASALKF
jgi:hypothetical protein